MKLNSFPAGVSVCVSMQVCVGRLYVTFHNRKTFPRLLAFLCSNFSTQHVLIRSDDTTVRHRQSEPIALQ